MNGGWLPTNQLHVINWGTLDHAARASQLMLCNYRLCVCKHVCVCVCACVYVCVCVCVQVSDVICVHNNLHVIVSERKHVDCMHGN